LSARIYACPGRISGPGFVGNPEKCRRTRRVERALKKQKQQKAKQKIRREIQC